MLSTPGGKDTPFLALDLKFMDDPWETQSTRSLCPGSTPLPKTPTAYAMPSGSDDFQAVLEEMYAEIEQKKAAKAKADKKSKLVRTLSRIPTRINMMVPDVVMSPKSNRIREEGEETGS